MIFCGDVLTVLRNNFGAESVQCVVTSPPYWGLRDYGTAQWEGGDDPSCAHVERTNAHGGTSNRPGLEAQTYQFKHQCLHCGAVRIDQQIGLEPTPEAYVAKMVEVFREVRRVLKADGTLWLNLGDSYVSAPKGNPGNGLNGNRFGENEHRYGKQVAGLKSKDLVGIPWRVAFALQADGWYLRSDIIWAKPNPMPESVTDRPTKAHEYLFLMSKSERYFYDQDAVRIPMTREWDDNNGGSWAHTDRQPQGTKAGHHSGDYPKPNPLGANRRSVWEIATAPYPDAHFATFPPKLIEPCILAGSRPGDTVLDPFAGSGTTLAVAKHFGRQGVGIELNPEYVKLAEARIGQVSEALPL